MVEDLERYKAEVGRTFFNIGRMIGNMEKQIDILFELVISLFEVLPENEYSEEYLLDKLKEAGY